MSIVYLTHDEVNAAVADRIAGRLGLDLRTADARDAGTGDAAGPLVLDLDHLPPAFKAELLQRAGLGRVEGVAVHSYHMSPGEVRSLRAAGVRVARRLTAEVLTAAAGSGVTPSLRRA